MGFQCNQRTHDALDGTFDAPLHGRGEFGDAGGWLPLASPEEAKHDRVGVLVGDRAPVGLEEGLRAVLLEARVGLFHFVLGRELGLRA